MVENTSAADLRPGSGCNQGRAGGHTKTYGGRRSEQPHDQYTAKGWKGGAKRVEGRQGWKFSS